MLRLANLIEVRGMGAGSIGTIPRPRKKNLFCASVVPGVLKVF
jgi:hypothetical protein